MMKGRKKAGILAAGVAAALFFSGCSFSGSVNRVMNSVNSASGEAVVSGSSEEGERITPKSFDDSLEVPSFSTDLSGTTNVVQNGSVTLQAEATVSDGGTVTYQWYSNTVSSNGGGTIIEGATADTYSPDTSEGGTIYYYVVAVNNHGDSVNEAASPVHGVTVWANMYWQQNADNGGYQYLNHDDGSYPSNTTLEIDGVTYTFNENGFAVNPDDGSLIDITTGGAAVAPGTVSGSSGSSEPAEAEGTEDQAASESTQDTAAEEQPAEQ